MVETHGETFKLSNNDFIPYYARLFMHHNKQHEGFLEQGIEGVTNVPSTDMAGRRPH